MILDSSGFFWIALLSQQFLAKMTKFRKFERKKKTERFLARPPHQNILPFPEADRREAEGKKKLKSFKRGRERLRIGQI